uniref:nuclear valosin-containing protein-like isoform X2 n=1 Tax=Myxine glutinosa TaxID=7769 RepID=UPI0035902F5C
MVRSFARAQPMRDQRLFERVRQYLHNSGEKYVDVASMAADLQHTYRNEYGRRQKVAFRILVERVYRGVCKMERESKLAMREARHSAKRVLGDDGTDMSSSEAESTDVEILDDEDFGDQGDRNQVNESLVAMYKDIQKDDAGQSVVDQSKSSPGGWFLDSSASHSSRLPRRLGHPHKPEAEDQKREDQKDGDLKKRQKTNRKRARTKGKNVEMIELDKSENVWPKPQRPLERFVDVGGNDDTLRELCRLLLHMRHPEVYQKLGVLPPRGLLLHGPPGCGKTLLARAIAGELELPLVQVAGPEVVSGVSGESEKKVRELFDLAVSSAPCVLFLDEIDVVTPRRDGASKEMERRIVAQILSCMDGLVSLPVSSPVMVLGATNRPDVIDPALRRAGRFDREICLGIPDEGARERILSVLCRTVRLPDDICFKTLAQLTPGYVGADLQAFCREAAMCAVERALQEQDGPAEHGELEKALCWLRSPQLLSPTALDGLCVQLTDFQVALSRVQPSAKREGFATVPDTTWDDIGALDYVRNELSLAILAPVRHPKCFQALGLSKPAGVLLAGPPGCGKTLVAKAIANESGLNFISVKGPELLNMSGATARVVNQLLTEMDGLLDRRHVFVMAATNRPDILDPAVMRPGRLDRTMYLGFPGPDERVAILKTLTKDGTKPPLLLDVDLQSLGQDIRTEGFTGADLAALVREAALAVLRQKLSFTIGVPADTTCDIFIGKQHFEEAFGKVKPSVSKQDRAHYNNLRLSLEG